MVKSHKPELALMGRFIESRSLIGQFFAEIPVGRAPKRIDLICVEGDFDWPVGGKPSSLLSLAEKAAPSLGKTRSKYGWNIPGVKPKSKDSISKGAVELNKKGMDKLTKCAIGHPCWLVEVKRNLNCEAIGQVMSYRRMFAIDYPQLPIKASAIVCGEGDADLEPICEELGIYVLKESEAFQPSDSFGLR